jgi:transposase-like protein
MNTTTTQDGTGEAGRPLARRRLDAGERVRVLSEWAASGRTVEEMAAATGWSAYTLYRWRQEAGQGRRAHRRTVKPTSQRLVAVPKPPLTNHGSWVAEIVIGAGLSVRLSPSCPAAWAGQVIRELRSC